MSGYSHRERVLFTLDHREPDRVPLDLMGNATMLFDQAYMNLRDHLGLSPIPPVRTGTTTNYYDERLLDYFDIDFRRVFLKRKRPDRSAAESDGSFIDAWGVRYRQAGLYMDVLIHPLRDAQTVKDIENYPWPNPEEVFTAEGLAEKAWRLYKETDYALLWSPGILCLLAFSTRPVNLWGWPSS
jgi:uroporphyrinogen decarboxylase